jgi:hypothetical protein
MRISIIIGSVRLFMHVQRNEDAKPSTVLPIVYP